MTESPFTCIDRFPALVLRDRVEETAIAVNPDNAGGGRPEAGGEPARFWARGSALRVRFLDGPSELHEPVLAAAAAWTDHTDLRFVVVPTGPAEIRVTFALAGNWSALGTDALIAELYGPDDPTMCLSEARTAAPTRLKRLARHEFGHAIGLIHEHSSPASGMRWRKDVVYTALAAPPNRWSRADVEYNVFYRYSATTTQFSAFDPESVMLYAFPPDWTEDHSSYPENGELSATDKAFVRQVYGAPRAA
jgi:hypothetical protein